MSANVCVCVCVCMRLRKYRFSTHCHSRMLQFCAWVCLWLRLCNSVNVGQLQLSPFHTTHVVPVAFSQVGFSLQWFHWVTCKQIVFCYGDAKFMCNKIITVTNL